MQTILISIAALVVSVGAIGFFWYQSRRSAKPEAQQTQTLENMIQLMRTTQEELARQRATMQEELTRSRQEIQRSLGQNQEVLQQRLSETNQTVNQRLGQAARLFSDISKGLGSVSEFSKQLSDLRDVFQSPKLRGNIGEAILKDLLEQILPQNNFDMQFKFREGQVVDAIVKTKQGLIPIDSKFPLENFRVLQEAVGDDDKKVARRTFERDVKKHIDAIHSKYILPEEGTVDFAVMYVPSESVYYEIVQNCENLMDHAAESKVYLVSPNTFYYFLKVIMIGLEGARMEELSHQILSLLRTVQKDAQAFGEELQVMSRHVTNAKNASERVSSKFERLSGTLNHANVLEKPAAQKREELGDTQNIEVQDLEAPVQQQLQK